MSNEINTENTSALNEKDLNEVSGGASAAEAYLAAEKRVKALTGCTRECHCYDCPRPCAKGRVISGLPH